MTDEDSLEYWMDAQSEEKQKTVDELMPGQVIFSYTDQQAIDDGVLVEPYPERWKHLLVTSSIHHDCAREDVDDKRSYDQRLIPLIMDCLLQCQVNAKKNNGAIETPVVLEHTYCGTVWVMENGLGGLTVMKPEDY